MLSLNQIADIETLEELFLIPGNPEITIDDLEFILGSQVHRALQEILSQERLKNRYLSNKIYERVLLEYLDIVKYMIHEEKKKPQPYRLRIIYLGTSEKLETLNELKSILKDAICTIR
ncbi:hypothetical protein D3C87_1561190 [compost metagenome]